MLDRDIEDTREPEWEEYDEEESIQCDICDTYFDPDQIHDVGDLHMCDDCYSEMVEEKHRRWD